MCQTFGSCLLCIFFFRILNPFVNQIKFAVDISSLTFEMRMKKGNKKSDVFICISHIPIVTPIQQKIIFVVVTLGAYVNIFVHLQICQAIRIFHYTKSIERRKRTLPYKIKSVRSITENSRLKWKTHEKKPGLFQIEFLRNFSLEFIFDMISLHSLELIEQFCFFSCGWFRYAKFSADITLFFQ